MSSALRKAAEQALETLENHVMQRTYADGIRISNTTLALRAALAEPEERQTMTPKELAASLKRGEKWIVIEDNQ